MASDHDGPSSSAFSFLSSQPADEKAPESGFGFLSSGDSPSSGFSFLGSQQAETAVPTSDVADTLASSVSYLNRSPTPPDMLGPAISTTASQEIKLTKTAQAKVVKKKKKSSKVGLGREDFDEGDVEPPMPPPPMSPAPPLPVDHSDVPPPELESAPASSVAPGLSPAIIPVTSTRNVAPVVQDGPRTAASVVNPNDSNSISPRPTSLTKRPDATTPSSPNTTESGLPVRRSFFGSIFGSSSSKSVPAMSSMEPSADQPVAAPSSTISAEKRPSISQPPAQDNRRPSLPPAEPSSPPPSYVPEPPPSPEASPVVHALTRKSVLPASEPSLVSSHPPSVGVQNPEITMTRAASFVKPLSVQAATTIVDTKKVETPLASGRSENATTPNLVTSQTVTTLPTSPQRPVPTAAKVETTSERLQREGALLFAKFAAYASAASQKQREVALSLRQLRTRVEVIEKDVRRVRQQLAEQETEQHRLAQLEEFDRADALTTTVEGLRNQLFELTGLTKQLNDEVITLQQDSTALHKEQSGTLGDVLEKIENIRKQQEVELEILREDADRRQNSEKSRIAVEEDRIFLEKKHIDREDESLREEAELTENSIASQSGDMNSRRDETTEQLNIISREIEDLEQQLRMKQAEQRRLRLELEGINSRINDVRRKYDRQLQRVADRREVIEANKAECAQEEAVLEREKQTLESDISQSLAVRKSLKQWCGILDSDIAVAALVRMTCSESEIVSVSASPQIDSEVVRLKAAEAEADNALAAALAAQAESKAQLDLLTGELRELEERIPKFESDKKAHAAAKRFKEAAAVAKDIAAFKSRQDEVNESILATTTASSERAEAVAECIRDQEAVETALREQRGRLAISRFGLLRLRLLQLRKARATILRESSASVIPDAPISADTFKTAALSLLEAEIDGLFEEASLIKDEYSLSEGIVDENDEIDEVIESEIVAETVVETNEGDSKAEQPVSEVVPEPPSPDNPAPEGEERHFLFLEAKEIYTQQLELNAQMEAASEAEDYDKAAEISEELEGVTTSLTELLRLLKASEAEVAAYDTEHTVDHNRPEPSVQQHPVVENQPNEVTTLDLDRQTLYAPSSHVSDQLHEVSAVETADGDVETDDLTEA